MDTVLDHLVLAVPDLDGAVADLARQTGVEPVAGGVHPGRGTRNALIGLTWEGSTRHYLEVLGPDPAQPDVPEQDVLLGAGPTLSGGVPCMYGWAVRTEPRDLDATLERARAAGLDVGEAVAASRETPSGRRLSWRLAVPRPLAFGGVQPFLLAWDDAHPTDSDLPTVELVSITLQHPEPERAGTALAVLGLDLPVGRGPVPRVRATLATSQGEVVLG